MCIKYVGQFSRCLSFTLFQRDTLKCSRRFLGGSELDYQMINQVYQYPGPRLKQECLQGFDIMHFIIERDMLCLGTWCIPMGVIYQL